MYSCDQTENRIRIETDLLCASIATTGYVSGIEAGSFVDKTTQSHDPGFGLLIMDFLLAPGWRRDGYERDPMLHGNLPKHYVEGPQICTQARSVEHEIFRGDDHLAFRMGFTYHEAGEDYRPGSSWEQTIVFKAGCRYVLAGEQITCVNDVDTMTYRMDIPGHVRHRHGDTFAKIYLSYAGVIDADAFLIDFEPDHRFLYDRDEAKLPTRFIRAVQLRDPDGQSGPWLAAMTLNPATPAQAWCHQRGYVCMIQENHGRRVTPGMTMAAAYVLGYFDTIDEMHGVYDQYSGMDRLEADSSEYQLQSCPSS